MVRKHGEQARCAQSVVADSWVRAHSIPGATISGLMRPSEVGPVELKAASWSMGELWEGRSANDTVPPSAATSHRYLSSRRD